MRHALAVTPFTVQKQSQTITFTAPAAQTFVLNGTFALSASSDSGLTVTSSTTSVCTVSGSTVTMLAVGACDIDANQAGDSSYNAAEQVSRTVSINTAGTQAATIEFTGNGQSIANGDDTPSAADGSDYGSGAVGVYTRAGNYTLTNNSGIPIEIIKIEVKDTPAQNSTSLRQWWDNFSGWALLGIQDVLAVGFGDFTVVTVTPFTINNDSSATFTINFTPTAAGLRDGLVVVTFSDNFRPTSPVIRFVLAGKTSAQ